MIARRRPSSAEGSEEESSSDTPLEYDSSCFGGGTSFDGDGGAVLEGGGGGGLGESALKSRRCVRILHCRQMEGRNEGRSTIRIALFADVLANVSNKSLGANRAMGCMAALLRNVVVGLSCWS